MQRHIPLQPGVALAGGRRTNTPTYPPAVLGRMIAEVLKDYTPEQRDDFSQGFLRAFPHGRAYANKHGVLLDVTL